MKTNIYRNLHNKFNNKIYYNSKALLPVHIKYKINYYKKKSRILPQNKTIQISLLLIKKITNRFITIGIIRPIYVWKTLIQMPFIFM